MTETNGSISRPPTTIEIVWDRLFRNLTLILAWVVIGVVILLVVEIAQTASPAVREYGTNFLTTSKWDPSGNKFGIVPQMGGTLYSSILGVAIGALFGIAVAIFLTQDFLPRRAETVLKNIIELLAAIPSVVYGLWGIFVLIPLIRPFLNSIHDLLPNVGIFGTRLSGP